MRKINQSELTTFQRCRRKWKWSYNDHLALPKYESNLSTGTAVHKALQAHYKDEDWKTALYNYWAQTAEDLDPLDPSAAQLAKDTTLSLVMMEGYMDWIAETGVDSGLTPVAIEEPFEFQLTPDVTLYGTLDLVQVDGDGNTWLFDHKTTASFAALIDRRLQMNFQLLTYAVLCEEFFGTAPTGAYLNGLRKVLRTGSAKPPFYHREPVHFNAHQLAAHRRHMIAILEELQTSEERIAEGNDAFAYPVVDGDCSWKCPFLSVCPMADDGSDIDGALNDLYVRRTGDR